MKRNIYCLITLICLVISAMAQAQVNEGIIDYEVKVNLHRTLPPERAEMKNMIPEFRTTKHELFFNTHESLYKAVIEDEEPMEASGGGMHIRMQQPHVEIYYDAAIQRRLIEEEFMGKDYLIEDSITVIPWKFSGEARRIMEFDCQKASYFDENRKQQVVAWYTTKLRPALGPEVFNSLPGAVLMVDINDGERVVLAKSLEARNLKKNELRIPDKGIKTTRSAFQKMREEQVQRMRANGANIVIRN
ncbi:GLPGLI family protein [Chryseolinea sp. T2]|uniref:GLPGLI family protein n=1 Tax=Chryseolinea sp. T2 TaxID=3129255 RepID=UPI0030773199